LIEGVIDGHPAKYFGFVFFVVWGCGVGCFHFIDVVLLALYAKQGGINV
jgi:hypothetical protein